MKKIFITVICCLTILLYIPFNTFAIEYNDDFNNLITNTQKSSLQNIFNDSIFYYNYYIHIDPNNVIIYSSDFNYSDNIITLNNYFKIYDNGNTVYFDKNLTVNIPNSSNKVIYLRYNNEIIFKNSYLNFTNTSENYLLFDVSNYVTNTVNGCTQSPNGTYYYGNVTVYYNSIINITGYNFDVYYLVDNSYRLIQENINSFQIIESNSIYKNQSSGNQSACIYPTAPSIPKDYKNTYKSSFKYKNFYFVLNDEIDLNTIIVKAPDTDSLLSDGNSNSQSVTSNNNQSNQLLDNTVNQMESLENGFKNDLNSNLDNINANDFNISGITQLSNAANFVKVQFDNLTKNNPFGTILGFSLFLGLSLLIIGKRL